MKEAAIDFALVVVVVFLFLNKDVQVLTENLQKLTENWQTTLKPLIAPLIDSTLQLTNYCSLSQQQQYTVFHRFTGKKIWTGKSLERKEEVLISSKVC